MAMIDSATELTVLCARGAGSEVSEPLLTQILQELRGQQIHRVGARPGQEIDNLLTGRILVIGDDADLASVVARLDRRQLLAKVVVAYAPLKPTPFAALWSLPVGVRSVRLAQLGDPDLVPLAMDAEGGVLIGEAGIGPVRGPVYLDDSRLINGPARGLIVQPDRDHGISVTVVPRRIGMIGRRPTNRTGAQVRIETAPATLVVDGHERADPVERWEYSRHPLPLRLVRGIVD